MDDQDRLIPARAVRDRFGGISHMTLWRWVQRGLLPEPVKINSRSYWREPDVDRLAAGRLEKAA